MTERKAKPSRREFLKSAVAATAAGATVLSSEGEILLAAEGKTTKPSKDTSPGKMPMGKIGNLEISRMISGSNLISMNMHARDLIYVNGLAAHYNTEERVLNTLKLCEEQGINAIVLKDHNFKRFNLKKHWDERGGKMIWIADVISRGIDNFERKLVHHLELGASAAYLWGGSSDTWYHAKKERDIVKAYEIMRKYKIPVGIGAHRLEPVMFCEKEKLKPDFYFLTLHHEKYWSAHPRENRRFIEMFERNSPDHNKYHDNMFCHDPGRTIEFMRDVEAPWIAFKVLAAGAISPTSGFKYALQNGADFMCVGMFDFQVAEDMQILNGLFARGINRKRSWRG